ncbi:ABC transporter ATP-binding protein [Corynebacterium sphenisci]|uniref:ABC transporter ATP-binding protein n=1 Tax=Corynebacterium sphenisci TaxID=191493 RepID=UPI0026DEF9AD|nr:ABC transporter ATP-binding protein [Corynebacterium sphenisci]MDO5730068.1 ABC transporter ATP-binding protein [Corynebacterium sphenisci]
MPAPSPDAPARPLGVRRGAAMLRAHLAGAGPALAAVLALSVVDAAAGLAQPLLVRRLIDAVGGGAAIRGIVALLAATIVLGAVSGAGQQYLLGRTAETMVRSLRHTLIGHLLTLPMAAYRRHRVGDLVSRVGADTAAVRAALTGGVVEALGGALVILGAGIAMFLLDRLLLAVAVGVLALAVTVVVLAGSRIRELARRVQESTGEMAAGATRALGGITLIRATGATGAETARVQGAADRAWAASLRSVRLQALLWPASGIAVQLAFLSVLGLGGARVAAGALTVADLVAFLMFLFMLMMPVGAVFGAISTIAAALGALSRIGEVLDSPAEDAADRPLPGAAPDFSGAAPAVAFEEVTFTHDGAAAPALDRVSFTAEAGAITAIVGPSGAGKSTLLELIERFAEPDSGVVRVGGADLRDLDRATLRAAIGYVDQAATAVSGTVAGNLALGLGEVDPERQRAALAEVNLLARVDAHPDGLAAEIGEGGVALSGGERQRLALARCLLADRPLLLLDEPTAALDSRNERALREAIAASARRRSVLIVAHRLATVADADRIIVLDRGRVAGIGDHAGLLAGNALYRELARDQLLG